jgi:hypothetical protein
MTTKNTKQEIPTDKRTKAYKIWKANYEKESKGLGDSVEKITKATGIKKVVEKFTPEGKDCGCDKRQERLNELFPYHKPKCLYIDEFNYLYNYFKNVGNTITPDVQKRLVGIYNRVFDEKAQTSSCGPCFLDKIHRGLEKVYNQYL